MKKNKYKFTIITIVKNKANTILKTIESVINQTFNNFQYIVIDGKSNDGTMTILNQHSKDIDIILSEKDKGIYDALNKGIALAEGEYIGFLHSDDHYYNHNVLFNLNKKIDEFNLDAIYGDANYFDPKKNNKIVRKYTSKYFAPKFLSLGIMPAHETLFVRKRVYDNVGNFNINFNISADFEWVIRAFHNKKLKYFYFPEVLINKQLGGISSDSIFSTFLISREMRKACKINNLPTNWFKISLRYFVKLMEVIK